MAKTIKVQQLLSIVKIRASCIFGILLNEPVPWLQFVLISVYIIVTIGHSKTPEVTVMITPMFGNRRKPKKFDYPYRHYDPEKEERRKRRIKIERPHKKHHQGRSILLYTVCLSFVVWLIYSLGAGKLAQLIALFD